MRVRDLGDLTGDVVIFGGPYSNIQALEALIRAARARGIPPERMICTGDAVAYCADPVAVAERLRDLGVPMIAGNCEERLAAGGDDCGCGFPDGTRCSLLARGWYAHLDAAVGDGLRAWMAGLPDRIVFGHGGRRHAVIHGGATDISRFVWPDAADAVLEAELAALRVQVGTVDVVLAGHCGIAFVRRIRDAEWVNAGAIGMPQNDGVPETRYVVLSGTGASVHRLSYDHAAAHRAMCAAGLTQGYHDALVTGCWPSEEVLPQALRRGVEASGGDI